MTRFNQQSSLDSDHGFNMKLLLDFWCLTVNKGIESLVVLQIVRHLLVDLLV